MINALKNLFNKKPKPGKDSKEPWVNVINTNIDNEDPKQGFMELEWNEPFVDFLKSHGYTGEKPEDIIDAWFTDLCRSIGQQLNEETKFVGNADVMVKKSKKRVDNKP